MNDKNKIPYCPPLRFPEFKDEWKKTTLGEVCDVVGGGTPSTDIEGYWNGEIQWFTPTEVGINKFISLSERTITEEGLRNSGAKLLPVGAILLTTRATIGEVSIATKICSTNQGFQSLVVKEKKAVVEFIYQKIQTLKKELLTRSNGSTFKEISASEVRTLSFYIPNEKKLCEQQKIANFLSLIDERIQCVSETIKELKRQKVELVNILIYNLNNKDKPLCLFGEMKNGYPFKSEEYETFGTHRIVTISNVTGDRYLNMDNHKAISNLPSDIQDYQMLSTNDILISLTGNVGRVSLCSKGGDLLNQRVGVFKLYDEFYREYVFQAISDNRFEKTMTALGQGAAQLNIYKKDVEEFIIPVPDNKADVIRISNFLSLIDERIEVEEKLLGQYEKQKKYLLSKMFV